MLKYPHRDSREWANYCSNQGWMGPVAFARRGGGSIRHLLVRAFVVGYGGMARKLDVVRACSVGMEAREGCQDGSWRGNQL